MWIHPSWSPIWRLSDSNKYLQFFCLFRSPNKRLIVTESQFINLKVGKQVVWRPFVLTIHIVFFLFCYETEEGSLYTFIKYSPIFIRFQAIWLVRWSPVISSYSSDWLYMGNAGKLDLFSNKYMPVKNNLLYLIKLHLIKQLFLSTSQCISDQLQKYFGEIYFNANTKLIP